MAMADSTTMTAIMTMKDGIETMLKQMRANMPEKAFLAQEKVIKELMKKWEKKGWIPKQEDPFINEEMRMKLVVNVEKRLKDKTENQKNKSILLKGARNELEDEKKMSRIVYQMFKEC